MNHHAVSNRIVITLLIITLQLGNIPQVYAQSADTASASNAATEKMPVIDQLVTSTSPYGSLLDFKDQGAISPIPLPTTVSKLPKTNFSTNEDISLTVDNTQNHPVTTTVTNGGGQVDTNIIQTTQDGSESITIMPPAQFKPGKYQVTVKDASGKSATQDFTWGVLAINTNKSIYAPGDKADLAMAVLDEKGEMVCDAKVTLVITDPKGTKTTLSTTDNEIVVNTDQCSSHKYTQTPDYEAHYMVGDAGDYTMDFTAETKNGTHEITDTFQVKKDVPFDVERVTATRIYPPSTYPVVFNIKANQDFDGFVTETVPQSFQVSAYDGPPLANEPKMTVSDSSTPDTQTPDTTVLGASTSAQTTASASATTQPTPVASISAITTPVASPSAQDVAASLTQTILDYPQPNSLTIPFIGNYPITEGFGATQTDPILKNFYGQFGLQGHDGIDFGVPVGTPIVAADDGKIITAGDWEYGKTVVIQHSWGRSYYGHLSQVMVTKDQQVIKGQQIALSGNTGESTGPHLHFGIRPNRAVGNNGYYGKIDPAPYLGLAEQTAKTNVLGAATTPPTDFIHGSRTVTWHVSVKKGEKFNLAYDYLAPRISPQFYTLGPLKFTDQATNTNIFQEARVWQIAADVATIVQVQNGSKTQVANCSSNTLGPSLGSAVAKGDLLIADLYSNGFSPAGGFTAADSLGNTWNFIESNINSSWTAYAVVTNSGSSDVVYFSGLTGAQSTACDAIEYSGTDTIAPLDQHSSNIDSSNGTSHVSNVTTITAPIELLHCYEGWNGSNGTTQGPTANNGFAIVTGGLFSSRGTSLEAFVSYPGTTVYPTQQCSVTTQNTTAVTGSNIIATFKVPTPTNDAIMRHGKWFENNVRQSMFW